VKPAAFEGSGLSIAHTAEFILHFRCKTSFGEFVPVPITRFDLDPTIFNGLVQPSLEIGVSHIDEMIASKYAARTNFVLYENAEDLAPYFFIGCHVIHPCGVSNRRSHKLNTTASDRIGIIPFVLRADEVIE